MKYFIDTEFKEKPNTIDLISIGIACEDSREYYAISSDFNLREAWSDEWLRVNVLLPIFEEGESYIGRSFNYQSMLNYIQGIGKGISQIKKEIVKFVNNDTPEFYGYYADYDWVVFCWIFGRMVDLPNGFPMYCKDLKQMMDERGLDKEWKQKNCPDLYGEHNALVDAKWNLGLYNAIIRHCNQ